MRLHFEHAFLEEQIIEIITTHLTNICRKRIIPLPEFNSKEFWIEPSYIPKNKILSNKGIAYLRTQIRKENQTWLKQHIISILALIIAGSSAFFSYSQSKLVEESMKYTNRPYLVLNGIEKSTNHDYMFSISNFGNTPSYFTKIHYDTFIRDSSFIPPDNFSMTNTLVPTIGGKKERLFTPVKVNNLFNPDTLQILESNNKFVFVAGKIEYMDIFNDKHGYYFCHLKSTDKGSYKFKDYNYAY
ncbi:MAG: hypothetical protein U5R06_23520 [candidate division KSB1 bacterium]|nr:hypothetical protein [candidate division KSB1 bacterium]